jgi:hypothetical protein
MPLEDHLSTVGAPDPLKVLKKFEGETVAIIVVAVEPRHSLTGQLEEKGRWIKALWSLALRRVPEVEGCRLSWNTLFFAAANQEIKIVVERFREMLSLLSEPGLESLCVISEAEGTAADKLARLDAMLDEISSKRNFGSDLNFQYRLLDGSMWTPN